MSSKKVTTRLLLILTVLLAALPAGSPAQPASAQTTSRTFPETGKTVGGKFLAYWNSHGGLAQQGFPISEEMQEQSDTDGKVYAVQYFERAVFEMHPENRAPHDVLLSLLGSFYYGQKYPSGAPGQATNRNPGAVRFPETGKTLGGAFLDYWQRNGGLPQQGFPISEEFTERSDLDGKTYRVQYFERAVFEFHPENSPPHNVLLSQLGTYRYQRLYELQHLDTLERVWALVRDRYVYTDYRGLDWQAIRNEHLVQLKAAGSEEEAYGVIATMVDRLDDRHSGFQDPEQAREEDALQRGELKLSGIGVFTQWIDDGARIQYVVPGGPADKGGLKPFDIIRAVDGTPLETVSDPPRLIRGPAGTPVKLTIESPGKARRDVTLMRETVTFTYHASAQRLPGTNVGYLHLPTFFQFGIADEVEREIRELAAGGPLDGLVVDVRQNGGGFLSELKDTEKLFIDGGRSGFEVTRSGRNPSIIPSGETLPALRGKPVVVLTSASCESACERFAVAMHDLKRGTILGTATAGNTETVQPYDLPDGSRLSLASATFERLDGSSIEDKGLTPNVVLDVPWYEYALADDPQVKAAVDIVMGR
jgi:C-terminal peptidase prc